MTERLFPVITRGWILVVLLLVSQFRSSIIAQAPEATKERVYAETFFTDVKDKVYIQTTANQVLVFDAEKIGARSLVLNGNDLDISAPEVEVIGEVKIVAYPAGATGTDNAGKVADAGRPGGTSESNSGCGRDGCTGPTGDPGKPGMAGGDGKPAGAVRLRIASLTGTGTLTIEAVGQKGGSGGRGGRGGNGWTGGPGHGASCGDWLGRHRDDAGKGGKGGRGGSGGAGGAGGKGGNGGRITFSQSLADIIGFGKLVLSTAGGLGGDGGIGGGKGGPGNGGPGGDGKGECGRARGDDGPRGDDGADGGKGETGKPGEPSVASPIA